MHPRKKLPSKTFDSALVYLRAHAFDVQEMPGVAGAMQIRKYGCGTVLGRAATGAATYIIRPGCLVGGEISELVDRGYQKFLITNRLEVPATADHLRALHSFTEEISEAAGKIDYYNLALGTVSDLYLYDRLQGRDPAAKAPTDSH